MSLSHILGFFFLNSSNFIFDGKMVFVCPVFTPGATFNVYKPPWGLGSRLPKQGASWPGGFCSPGERPQAPSLTNVYMTASSREGGCGVYQVAPLGWDFSRKWYKAVSEGSGSGMSPLHPASRTVRVLPQLLAGAAAQGVCPSTTSTSGWRSWTGGTFLPNPLPQRPAPSPWVSGVDTSQASQTWNLLYVVIWGGEYGVGIFSAHFLYLFCICRVCLLSEDGAGFPPGVPGPSPLAPTRRGHPELSQESPPGGPVARPWVRKGCAF